MMNTELKTMDKAAVEAAFEKACNAPIGPPGPAGCARIYVCVHGVDRKTINAIAAACKKRNMIFQRKAYYSLSNAIYIGYSMHGREFAKGEAFAQALTEAGIPAYSTAEGD